MGFDPPFFSILIPAYNISQYIEECINSVRSQTYSQWEAIIVDDGSTDGTGELCDQFQKEDGRIRVLHQKNQGVAVARNVLLKEARGEYLIFLDGDDFWYSEKMLFEVQEAIRVRNADMVAWWLKTLDNETEVSKENRNFIKEYKECPTGKRFLKDMLSEGRNCWWSWLYAFHRSLWENCDTVFKPGRIICEDEEVLYRIFLQAQRVWVIGKYYYAYRTKRGDSATGILSVQGICSRLEVAEGNIRYLQESETVEEELKRALIRNFSFTWMNIGENIYRLEESRRECIRLLKNKKWMVHNLWGYGAVKIRMKTILIYICGVKLGLWILWIWGKWKRKTLQ